MKQIIKVVQTESAPFNLTWTLGYANYSWEAAYQFITELKSRHAKIRCSITDESNIHNPLLANIVDEFDSDEHTVSLTTTGNIDIQKIENIASKLMWICFNYRADRTTEEYFINLNIAKQITRCGAKIAMLPTHWDQCVEIYEKLSLDDRHETGIDRQSGVEYSQPQLDWFSKIKPSSVDKSKHIANKKFPNAGVMLYYEDGTHSDSHNVPWLINNQLTQFTGYTCEIGLKSMYINRDGIIKRGLCEQGEIIGSLNEPDNIKWPVEPITCTAFLCQFATDVRINKWKIA
jgi:hypothetical protein